MKEGLSVEGKEAKQVGLYPLLFPAGVAPAQRWEVARYRGEVTGPGVRKLLFWPGSTV